VTGATLIVIASLIVMVAVAISIEGRSPGAREIALVGALAAVAAAGRVLTAGIPSVQPVTLICLVAGGTLGLRVGLSVGPLAVLISNGFLGHGPWTPGQMALWALVGVSGAALAGLVRNRWILVAAAGVWGPLFGWGMNLWSLAVFGPTVSWAAFVASGARSLPFEVAGGVGNVVLAVTAGPALTRLLQRYAARCDLVVVAAPETGSPLARPPWRADTPPGALSGDRFGEQ